MKALLSIAAAGALLAAVFSGASPYSPPAKKEPCVPYYGEFTMTLLRGCD